MNERIGELAAVLGARRRKRLPGRQAVALATAWAFWKLSMTAA
jgi:hypothetical protein